MRRVRFDPGTLTGEDREWWVEWEARALRATERVIAAKKAGEEFRFDNTIWSSLKTFLLDRVFYGKCAYCQTSITPGFVGDAEHYRPKGKVTVRQDGRDTEAVWQGQPHPGYYWLAYDWRNLFPTCSNCNSFRGKMTQFPVETQHIGSHDPPPADPDTLDQKEKPLILNPYRHDPEKHLLFGEKGTVSPRTPHGEKSIAVYSLDREPLRVDRQRAQELAWHRALMAFGAVSAGRAPIEESLAAAMRPYEDGTEEYSAAAIGYVRLMTHRISRAVAHSGDSGTSPDAATPA